MKKIVLIILLIFSLNTYAYKKSDILSLADSFYACDSETQSILNGYKKTYTRVVNEREFTDSELNQIINNFNIVKNILNSTNTCSKNDTSRLSNEEKNLLKSLYEQTNDIILNAKTIDGDSKETNIVLDPTTKTVKLYEDGKLSDVYNTNNKLNYVGVNLNVYIVIIVLSILLVILIIIRKFKKNYILNSLIFILILLIPILLLFREDISLLLNTINNYKNEEILESKDIKVKDNKIIEYPSFGTKYAKIYINKKESDIVYGDSNKILKNNIGTSTNYNIFGDGKVVLSGHNTGLFKELNNLKINDTFKVETNYISLKYKVKKINKVKETDIDSLNKDYDLIMYTCINSNKVYSNYRLIIYSDIVETNWKGSNNEE